MNEASFLLLFCGGLSFFIYGIRLARIGLQEVSEDRLRALINTVTKNRFVALGTGVLMTTVLQSSSATTIMLVGFANTGLIGLRQAMGVILGADIGTTITVQLISFHLANWSLVFVILGIFLSITFRNSRLSHVGGAILGFGLLFYGMNLMSTATSPLKTSEEFQQILHWVSEAPIISLLIAAVFTSIAQSSAATIGVVLSFAQAGSMTLEVAIPMVLGANIGTCAPAMVAGLASEYRGKQVAYAHLAFKTLGVLFIIFLVPQCAQMCRLVSETVFWGRSSVVREIANFHTFFNLAISVGFLPFLNFGAKILERIVPPERDSEVNEKRFRVQFLDENAVDTPALALGCVTSEILRVAGMVHGMFKNIIAMFESPSESFFEQIEEEDDRVDYLDREIRFYLAKISRQSLTQEQASRQAHLLDITTNLEHIGDTVNRDLVNLARKKREHGVSFSKEGWQEIVDFHAKVGENFNLAISAFADREESLARKVLRHERTLGELEGHLKQNHLARLQQGLRETFDTSSIHLELLAEMRRINTLLTHLAYSVIDQK